MSEAKITYVKKLLLAVEIKSASELDWFTKDWVKDRILLQDGPLAVGEQSGVCHFQVDEHSCPGLATGSVEAAFQRIDRLEERLCRLIEKVVVPSAPPLRAAASGPAGRATVLIPGLGIVGPCVNCGVLIADGRTHCLDCEAVTSGRR